MDSSPALLPIQLPGHFADKQLVVTDKLVNSTSHPIPIPLNQIAIPGPLHDLETNAFWDGPLSPHTVQNILAGHENLAPTQLQALVTGLTTTIQQRETIYNSKANHFQKHLADINTECQALKQCLQNIDGESRCCSLMNMRIIMEDSPYLLSLVQMGTILLSSSSNWMMEDGRT